LIDEIINLWKTLSGQSKISVKTKSYRDQIKGRIKGLATEKDITEHDDIIEAFRYVFTNKREHANDDEFRRFSVPDWNLTTLTRPKHFNTYLDEPKHGAGSQPTKPADKDAKRKRDWIDRLPLYIDCGDEIGYKTREEFAELYFSIPKGKRDPLKAMIQRQREEEGKRGGDAKRVGELVGGIGK
jgi:hypothetical protein